jgi:hypothetical protein
LIEIAPATAADVEAVYGRRQSPSMQAFAARVDGEAVAVCGLYYSERQYVAFLQLRGEVGGKTVVRLVHTMIDRLVRNKRAPVYAIRDESLPTSAGLLAHFGFRLISKTADGEVYQWQEH